MKIQKNDSESGFTLIEVIITFVLVAIVAAMISTYFGSSITQSSIPIFRLNAAGKLNAIMERITTEYEYLPRWSPGKSYAANEIVIPTPTQKKYYRYKCTVAGTSGTTEPTWLVSGPVSDGTGPLKWTSDGASPTLTELKTSINAHTADAHFGGNYRIVQNGFIKFDTGTHQEVNIDSIPGDADYGKYLKVTIGLPTGAATNETLTTLFVLR